MKYNSDILIIGTGIAGMTAAYYAAEQGLKVHLLTKGHVPNDSNTYYAQGGIIYKGKNDSIKNLVNDIIKAGAKLSNPEAVELLAKEGPNYIEDLLIKKSKINFTKNNAGKLDLTEEAAHSTKRIIHSKDATGKAISEGLLKLIKKSDNIKIYQQHIVLDLILKHKHTRQLLSVYEKPEILGAYVMDIKTGTIRPFTSQFTILATGGLGQIYSYTTNPLCATGDGFAIAKRAGAEIINMEYTQFHPTAFYLSQPNMFLISEAVRGEGGRLKTIDNNDFMKKYDKRGSLAPRDIVSRAIHEEMLKQNHPYVLLDIHSYLPPETIQTKFPTIYKTCLKHNIDITKQPIPVAPAFHFICGGVKVDKWGTTNINRLLAIGEVSCTGIHGANRLASTSLLEGLVWGGRSIKYILKNIETLNLQKMPPINKYSIPNIEKEKLDYGMIKQDWDNLKNIMWNYVGLVRNTNRLTKAITNLNNIFDHVENTYKNNLLDQNVIELKNAIYTAFLIASHANQNKKSKGTHFRQD